MTTIIVYATKFGSTEKCAKKLAEKLLGEVEVINLKSNPKVNLSKYDTVIIGGPIMVGKINPDVKKFYNNNLSELNLEKMNFALRTFMKKMFNTNENVSNILEDNISRFAKEMGK